MNESDKVIDAQRIKASETGGNARNPPCESGATMLAPSVVRMTPQLARGAETIGRNSSHHFGATASVEAEQARIVLNVSGIKWDKDRDIAQQENIQCRTARTKQVPLPLKFPLNPDVIRGVRRCAALRHGKAAPTRKPRSMLALKGAQCGRYAAGLATLCLIGSA